MTGLTCLTDNPKLLSMLMAFLLAVSGSPLYGQQADSALLNKKTFTGEELIRGERLFFGLAYPGSKSVNCAGCHNTTVIDTLNWNPDALTIALKYHGRSAAVLQEVLLKPVGKKMLMVHEGFQLTTEDIILIKAYMDELTGIGLQPPKPVMTRLILFIIAAAALLFSSADLMMTKLLRKKWIHYISLLVSTIIISSILVTDAIALGRSQGYSPLQPVKFSHAVHAGQNRIDCLYCHSYAHVSKSAGIPAVNVYMNCHFVVRSGTRSGVTEISKILVASDSLRPVAWIKVHNLPDHVFFSHAQHTAAGGVACRECHGNVEKMDVIAQVSDLSMGWCINCHRQKTVKFKSNIFYSAYRDTEEKMRSGIIDSAQVVLTGGTECMRCHY